MGIILIKLFKRINSLVKIITWKILYFNKFKIGKKIVFYPGCHVVIDRGLVEIGNNCFFNHNCSINSLSKIKIGNDCLFGENVKIYDHNHNYKKEGLIRKQGFKKNNIEIGNNCWIGSNVVILPGITIGDNVVIGANTIVSGNINDNKVIVNESKYKEL